MSCCYGKRTQFKKWRHRKPNDQSENIWLFINPKLYDYMGKQNDNIVHDVNVPHFYWSAHCLSLHNHQTSTFGCHSKIYLSDSSIHDAWCNLPKMCVCSFAYLLQHVCSCVHSMTTAQKKEKYTLEIIWWYFKCHRTLVSVLT